MAVSLLSTKLHVPRSRASCVARTRLTEALLAAAKHPGGIVLLSGPAGFGKTTLLGEFVAQLPQPVGWVSLEEADNDPSRFWTYVIAACQSVRRTIGEAALALLQALPSLPDETLPTTLINDIDRLDTDLILILDDYHVIQNPSIHTALSFLIEHLPEKLHLVLSTRVDPPWPLARLRARARLTELRASDLRFTPEETAAFLTQVMGLDLSAEDIAALAARTEGWVASLQLAAISMKGRSDVTGFVRAFTGSHAFVAEYLMAEVLERQPEALQMFLLQTSILGRLSAGLCRAVTLRGDSQAVLKELSEANLFLLPLDEERQWFRYHQLFADLLKARLQGSLAAVAIAELHRRAAGWYEENGMISDAIAHTLAAGDYLRAVRLIEEIAMPMIMKAHFKTVEDWLRALPPEWVVESPRIHMAMAWMHLMRRDFSRAAPHLARLQTIFSAPQAAAKEPSLQGEWLALQSVVLGGQGRAAESRDMAEQALKTLPAEEAQVRSMTYMALANAYEQMLDYDRAEAAAQAILKNGRAAGDLAAEVFGLSFLGRMILQQGRLQAAYDLAWQALQRFEHTGSFSPFSATLYGELAQVYYYWHRLAEAREYFARSVQWSTLGGFSDAEIYHSVFLSRLFQIEGDLPAAAREIEKALEQMQTAAPALVREEVISQQVSILLSLDRCAAAETALRPYGFAFDEGFSYPELAPDADLPHALGLLYNSALRVVLYRGRQQTLVRGIGLAEQVIAASLGCRQLPIALQTLLLRAQLQKALGQDKACLADVMRALELAEPEGFISIFLEEGQPVAGALEALLRHGALGAVQPGYVRRILAAFPGTRAAGAAPGEPSPPGGQEAAAGDELLVPLKPLTRRELDVLRLIAAGDSNRAIARKLVITLSAVKKHTGNIFHKLNAHSRTQALVHARQLGLLLDE